MDRLKDKVAIVTGSTSGIGKGIAKMFATEGARVVVCGRREERGAAIVDEIKAAGGEAMYHFLDVTKPETVDALLADTEATWGKIDVMVNNAAGMALKWSRGRDIARRLGRRLRQRHPQHLLLHEDRPALPQAQRQGFHH